MKASAQPLGTTAPLKQHSGPTPGKRPRFPHVSSYRSSALSLLLTRRFGHSPTAPTGVLRVRRVSRAPIARRDRTVAAAETVALVLDDNVPLPETSDDVETLADRLRDHICQLAPALPAGHPVVTLARELSSAALPDGYVSSRAHLVSLAEATRSLIEAVRRAGPVGWSPTRLPSRPSRNTVRVLVFAVALATLALAASVPRA
ncbi:DUF6415 family natural product biosynthesis protein [Streptomyces rubradiris]|uniref:DUF6415 family natural product biosynthesis protein n=1 Tax=Streptomyces rubradiris TaxID=285531 RepID=UPI0036E9A4B0